MTATLLLVTCILRGLLSLGLMHGLQSEQAQVWWTRWTNAMGAALASLQDICSVNICVSAVSFSFWSPLIRASFNLQNSGHGSQIYRELGGVLLCALFYVIVSCTAIVFCFLASCERFLLRSSNLSGTPFFEHEEGISIRSFVRMRQSLHRAVTSIARSR